MQKSTQTYLYSRNCNYCGKFYVGRGKYFCSPSCHYAHRNAITKSAEERFWAKVDKKSDDECWEWKGAKGAAGYGHFEFNSQRDGAHRIAYRLTYGEIPKGLYVCHKCDNRPCCNPKHLFAGTQKENMKDWKEKGGKKRKRTLWTTKGSKNGTSKLKESDIIIIRSLRKSGKSLSDIADIYNVCFQTISLILRGKTWKHI